MIDGKGVYPTKDKVRTIQEAPPPSNVKELRAFLGLVNYYGRYYTPPKHCVGPILQIGNVHDLSSMPLSEIKDAETEAVLSQIHTLLSNHFKEAPLNARQVARVTRMDCELYHGGVAD